MIGDGIELQLISISCRLHLKGGLVEAVAAEWRQLPPKARAHWEEMAETEKKRFATERVALCKAHKGPVVRKLRAKKNPVSCFMLVVSRVSTTHSLMLISHTYWISACTQATDERLPHVRPTKTPFDAN